jgi:DNA adenine methylase
MDAIDALDRMDEEQTARQYCRDLSTKLKKPVPQPFGYPGGKSRLATRIAMAMPYTDRYIEVFGGSGIVLLSRAKSKMEVYNDLHSGVAAFYRCMASPTLSKELIDRTDYLIHSRETFLLYKENWPRETDDVTRALQWYFVVKSSFSSLGRHFGECVDGSLAKKLGRLRAILEPVSTRMRSVTVEMVPWDECIRLYDDPRSVFYLDPPYLNVYPGTYEHELTVDEHRHLIDVVDQTQGYVALSGVANDVYDAADLTWDARIPFDHKYTIEGGAISENNNKTESKGAKVVEELLWIKFFGNRLRR